MSTQRDSVDMDPWVETEKGSYHRESTLKENPKYIQAQKDDKDPLEYLVWSVLGADARVHKHGADKYGVCNWRVDAIKASTYVGAIARHLSAWSRGEDLDPDSGLPHLNHIRACCAVVLDSIEAGTLIDDRLRTESKGETTCS